MMAVVVSAVHVTKIGTPFLILTLPLAGYIRMQYLSSTMADRTGPLYFIHIQWVAQGSRFRCLVRRLKQPLNRKR
jgi:hypothetical protein